MKILLALTFVFGVIRMISLTKLFDTTLIGIIPTLFNYNSRKGIGMLFERLDVWFFYFSLCFQAWYWLFSGKF